MTYETTPIAKKPTEPGDYFILENHLMYDIKSVANFNSGKWTNISSTATHWLKPVKTKK